MIELSWILDLEVTIVYLGCSDDYRSTNENKRRWNSNNNMNYNKWYCRYADNWLDEEHKSESSHTSCTFV